MIDADVLAQLASIAGERNVLTDAGVISGYLVEPRQAFRGVASCVVRPGSTAEVAAIVTLAYEKGIPVVPQGGNTGLVGAQIPTNDGREIILSLTRMNAVREIDPVGGTMTIEAGATLANAQAAADSVNRLYPLSLPSEGTCTVGGNLGSNAGGTAVLAYGNTRELCLGLEVVLPDGRIWNGLNKLRKDNTGYDLKNLFIGAEGTLGIITAAVLKLFPKPKSRATGFVAVPSPEAALALLGLAREMTGGAVTTFELLVRRCVEFVTQHSDARDPFMQPAPWYVLMELSSQREGDMGAALEEVLAAALEQEIASDATIAASLDHAKQFWRLREGLSEVQKFEGTSVRGDVSVPVADVPAFLHEAIEAVTTLIPGCRPLPFGHMGDGNIHFNVVQPKGADGAAYYARKSEIDATVNAVVRKYHGSISAEHGIGRAKRHLLPGVKDPVALELMHSLKSMLDPKGIMNPGSTL